MPFRAIFLALWLILVAYWIFSAWGNKPTAHRVNPVWRLLFIAAFVALVAILIAFPRYFHSRVIGHSEAAVWTGVAICASGVALAIWARRILGKNWSGNPTIKVGHELVEDGPYRFVRHPIYTGFLLGIIGTGIARGQLRDLVILAFALVTLWIKLRAEETLMLRQFPQAYPEYMKRTKALIPFVL